MEGHSLFNFRPSCLVRMSADDIIDQYDIFPIKIGEGNDAVVYKAKQKTEKGQWRAVKKIHRRYVEKEEYLLSEIQILKKLDHPGALKIFEVFDDSEYVFIVTELCEGNSLLKELRKRGCFKESEAKVIFKRIIEIVAYCHENKIIHRDLKLQNMVYCSKDHTPQSLRVIDFGMSFNWQLNARVQLKNTFSTNKVVGTIYYMAPQIHKETYDHRVDIWSAGVILFFLLAGELPFLGDYDEEILRAIEGRKAPYQKLRQKGCSQQVIQLMQKMFESQYKRITVEQILNHPWLHSLAIKQQKLEKFTLYDDSHKKIISQRQNQGANFDSEGERRENGIWIDWKNVYEFLKMSEMEKGIKTYLSYRLGHTESHKLIRIFDDLKQEKKQRVELGRLYEYLNSQYKYLQKNWKQDQNQNEKMRSFSSKKIPQTTNGNQKDSTSKLNIYKELLTYFQHHKHHSIGFTIFAAMISDYSQFDPNQVQFLRTSLSQKGTQNCLSNTLETAINQIHHIISQKYLENRKIPQPTNLQLNIVLDENGKNGVIQRQRELPKLRLNLAKDPKTNLYIKKSPKKTIKQNLLESISPTFIRRKPLPDPQYKAAETQRSKPTSQTQNQPNSAGFLFGLNRILPFF